LSVSCEVSALNIDILSVAYGNKMQVCHVHEV